MKSIGLWVIVSLFLCGIVSAERTIWYVHPDSALNTIQAGLDSCADNDIVLVASGTYVENVVWPNTQGIHLISELGPEVTIIDGDSTGTVIDITYDVDSTTLIQGFSIQNGLAQQGGGIRCVNSSPMFCNLIISENRAYYWDGPAGGGLYFNNSSALLHNIDVRDNATSSWNDTDRGGGIFCESSNLALVNVTISDNHAQNFAGGLACRNCPYLLLTNVDILRNNALVGGGVGCYGSSPIFTNCSINNNTGGGVYCYGGANPLMNYNDIFDNTGYGVNNNDPNVTVDARNNWWGDQSGPYHPTLNPGGLGDTVINNVDFVPWLSWPVGVEEQLTVVHVETRETLTATIFRGPLQLPEGKKCRVFDIMGRIVKADQIQPGIYFLEIDNRIVEKVVKIR